MSEVTLRVNGRQFGGWKSVGIVRSIQSLAGSFRLSVSERWSGQAERWPIAEEDACTIAIDGETVIDGYIDGRSVQLDGSTRALTFTGRDKAAALVDCSVLLERWTFRNATVFDVARELAEPFGIAVRMQSGLVLADPPAKLVVNPGEKAFHVIARAAKAAGVLVVSDGAGGIAITRAGTDRAAPIVEGENMLTGAVDFKAAGRFARYVCLTQIAGNDTTSGKATQIRAEATDENVRRVDRVLVIRPEMGTTNDYARQRADWEARNRAAKSETVRAGVRGWRQPDGALWPVNALSTIKSPALSVDGDMLISQVEYTVGPQGELAKLSLMRPDAFTPEPKLAKVRGRGSGGTGPGSGSGWKELAGGA